MGLLRNRAQQGIPGPAGGKHKTLRIALCHATASSSQQQPVASSSSQQAGRPAARQPATTQQPASQSPRRLQRWHSLLR
jgi:hypothetical protein